MPSDGLVLSLDASVLLSSLGDGDEVSSWVSGAGGVVASASGSRRPVLVAVGMVGCRRFVSMVWMMGCRCRRGSRISVLGCRCSWWLGLRVAVGVQVGGVG